MTDGVRQAGREERRAEILIERTIILIPGTLSTVNKGEGGGRRRRIVLCVVSCFLYKLLFKFSISLSSLPPSPSPSSPSPAGAAPSRTATRPTHSPPALLAATESAGWVWQEREGGKQGVRGDSTSRRERNSG